MSNDFDPANPTPARSQGKCRFLRATTDHGVVGFINLDGHPGLPAFIVGRNLAILKILGHNFDPAVVRAALSSAPSDHFSSASGSSFFVGETEAS